MPRDWTSLPNLIYSVTVWIIIMIFFVVVVVVIIIIILVVVVIVVAVIAIVIRHSSLVVIIIVVVVPIIVIDLTVLLLLPFVVISVSSLLQLDGGSFKCKLKSHCIYGPSFPIIVPNTGCNGAFLWLPFRKSARVILFRSSGRNISTIPMKTSKTKHCWNFSKTNRENRCQNQKSNRGKLFQKKMGWRTYRFPPLQICWRRNLLSSSPGQKLNKPDTVASLSPRHNVMFLFICDVKILASRLFLEKKSTSDVLGCFFWHSSLSCWNIWKGN